MKFLNDQYARVLIEFFGIVGGAAFVVSGIANALAFGLVWRLNYFLIASPSDVIMSGFIFVTVFIAGALFVAGVISLFRMLFKQSKEATARRVEAKAEDVEVEADWERIRGSVSEEFASAWLAARKEQRAVFVSWNVLGKAFGMVTAIMLGSVLSGQFVSKIVEGFDAARHEMARPRASVRPFWYETGLYVGGNSDVGGAICKGAHVAWIGSSAAILECTDGIHVIHKLDELETVKRP